MVKKEKIVWGALEHTYREKTSDWYWMVGIVGLTGAIVAGIFGNIIFGILLVIATFSILLHGAHVPRIITIELQERGIRIGSEFYPYKMIKSFSIGEDSVPPVLALDCRAWMAPDIRVFIEDTSPEKVRDYLLDHLDEIYHDPSFVEGLIHYLGF